MPLPEPPTTYVVGDIHGHRDQLRAALQEAGLVDDAGDWAGRDVALWFLGDFVDRGPDGVGVIDDVMRLGAQASQSAGSVDSVLGNHEVLLLGFHRFGDAADAAGLHSFGLSWLRNGGRRSDQERLTDAHLEWLTTRPAMVHAADHLLMHSDTTHYLEWGGSVEEINATVTGRLTAAEPDLEEWFDLWRNLTSRGSFRHDDGPQQAAALLDTLGGERIVHGHTIIAEWLGVPAQQVTGPVLYAGDRVLGIDAGLFAGGPCLVVPLPYEASASELGQHLAEPRDDH
ncbi:metallophosphoesterase [Luteipulveratus flavus]|uniref:Metallophosphoesterase n=1 Tax=Luteipulveratus flavus TaxID=3031728 RepID=A0ABT6C7V7_9MICO|nr:metallophosphoesterase [Luteipulveratus sp. YIM 133296]MDF8264613.1 metallophosphoesterase [Luteipulveratus sp. YIM 133296]